MNEEEFQNMFFIPALPVYQGDELQVQCFGGTVHLGAETVTCESGSEYNHAHAGDNKPTCREIGKTSHDHGFSSVLSGIYKNLFIIDHNWTLITWLNENMKDY